MMIKNARNMRMQSTCFFSVIFLANKGLIKSRVNVELDVSTRLERVDMDAESTRTITIPIRISGSDESIVGMIISYLTVPSAAASIPDICENPPRK